MSDNQRIYDPAGIDANSRLPVAAMPYEMTHLILMLKGPDATEFIDRDGDGNETRNFGNVVTWLEMKMLSISFFLADSLFQYYVLYFGVSLLGFFSETIYYSFHLLDVITRFSALQNVVRAVADNIRSLSATFLLLVIIVYVYTSWTFFYIQDNMYDWDVNGYDSDIVGENNCLTMYQCYVTMLDKGLRFGGGIGDVTEPIHWNNMREKYFVKLAHDASFHIIVKVIMLNVLFGQIIDRFAILRDQKQQDERDRLGKCFICHQERLLFDKFCADQGGFVSHIQHDHNMWMYVYYRLHLKQSDPSEHNGLESDVQRMIDCKDNNWIPRLNSIALQDHLDGEEDSKEAQEFIDKMKTFVTKIRIIE